MILHIALPETSLGPQKFTRSSAITERPHAVSGEICQLQQMYEEFHLKKLATASELLLFNERYITAN